MLFRNRTEAGNLLADALKKYLNRAIVLAIPRGGVVVGFEVAKKLNAQFDVVVSRKIGAENDPELALGAVAEDGSNYINESIVTLLGMSEAYVKSEIEKERKEVIRRVSKYREGKIGIEITGKKVIVIDDGIATGYTMIASCRFLRKRSPERLIIAVPVCPIEIMERLSVEADEIVCLYNPKPFYGIGEFYDNFEQTTDEEVIGLLKEGRMH